MFSLKKENSNGRGELTALDCRAKNCIFDAVSSWLAEYESAINRCYNFQSLVLALCQFKCFNEFSSEPGALEQKRHTVHEDGFELAGVVHEYTIYDKHVPCTLMVFPGHYPHCAADNRPIGSFSLTHTGCDDRVQPEIRPMILQASLYDPTGTYKSILREAMRDAALSGNRFMLIELQGIVRNNNDIRTPVELMRDRGYGPGCSFNELKLSPQLLFPNAPDWAKNLIAEL